MWKIVTQNQTEHLGNFCTLSHAIKYEGGQFQLKQRIIDSQDGYEEGQKRARLVEAAPDMLNELEDILHWAEVERAPLRELEMKSIRKVIEKARRG